MWVDIILSQVQVRLAASREDVWAGARCATRGRIRRTWDVFYRLLGGAEKIQIIELLFR